MLRKVREIQEKWLVSHGNLTFSCLTRNNATMPRMRKKNVDVDVDYDSKILSRTVSYL